MQSRALLLTVLASTICASLCLAQNTAVLTVEVKDVAGAVIPGAEVSIAATNHPQTATRMLRTDSNGIVSLDLLLGTYEVSVEMKAFASVTKQVVIISNRPQTLPVALRVYSCPPDPCPIVVPEQEYQSASPSAPVAVPDEPAAVKLAEKALARVYGRKKIHAQRPFTATLTNGIWHVVGTLYCKDKQGKVITGACVGGVAMAQIRQSDGRVMKTGHTM